MLTKEDFLGVEITHHPFHKIKAVVNVRLSGDNYFMEARKFACIPLRDQDFKGQ